MNRRHFVLSGAILSGAILIAKTSQAEDSLSSLKDDSCLIKMDHVTAEATYFSRYEHFHILAIPISILINPPVDGFKTRTSPLDQASLDEKAFKEFINDSGLHESSLRVHSHEVLFKQSELERIATGEKEVEITIMTPKGNLAHRFYFTASPMILASIKNIKSKKVTP